jgi:DNA-binding SARP family transcriptional activator/DNA-binding XRE family transcriptional regulator
MATRLGSYVQRLRRDAGLTQQQAADLAGLSIGSLRDLEQGRITAPRSATLRRLAEALRLSAADTDELLRRSQPGQFPDDELWLQVLGPVALQVDGARVELGSSRQRLLLGVLALAANSPVSQERLIETIWGNRPPGNVAELLQTNATRLRRRLREHGGDRAPELVTAPGSYQLTIAENQLDLLLFRRLAGQAQRAWQAGDPATAGRLLAEGIALWRGDPFADLASLRTDPEVAGLSREWQAAAVGYAATAIELGRPDDALPLLWRVVEADPLHEAAYAQLLIALSVNGQPADASTLFEKLRRRLAEELGTDPGPELVRAYQAARRRDRGRLVSPTTTVRRQLPADLAEFTGREAELAALHAAADNSLPAPRCGAHAPSSNSPPAPRCGAPPPPIGSGTAATVLSIVGTAGVGKTGLAVHFAQQLLAAGRYPDLQLYVDLGGCADQPPGEPASVLAMLLRLLGVAPDQMPPDLPGRAALYRDRLFGRAALVLLDNVSSEEWVQPLLPGGPTNLVLLTSRRSLALDGGRVVPLDVLPPADAERLLARIAGPERVSGDLAGARRLVELCGQLPLAVSLAARRLRARPSWRPSDLADRLQHTDDLLAELAAGSDQLRTVFDASYRRLTDDEQRLFRLLGGHAGDEVTAECAAALTGLPRVVARRLLDRLVDEHLAMMDAGERYRLPLLLRHYARGLDRPG